MKSSDSIRLLIDSTNVVHDDWRRSQFAGDHCVNCPSGGLCLRLHILRRDVQQNALFVFTNSDTFLCVTGLRDRPSPGTSLYLQLRRCDEEFFGESFKIRASVERYRTPLQTAFNRRLPLNIGLFYSSWGCCHTELAIIPVNRCWQC